MMNNFVWDLDGLIMIKGKDLTHIIKESLDIIKTFDDYTCRVLLEQSYSFSTCPDIYKKYGIYNISISNDSLDLYCNTDIFKDINKSLSLISDLEKKGLDVYFHITDIGKKKVNNLSYSSFFNILYAKIPNYIIEYENISDLFLCLFNNKLELYRDFSVRDKTCKFIHDDFIEFINSNNIKLSSPLFLDLDSMTLSNHLASGNNSRLMETLNVIMYYFSNFFGDYKLILNFSFYKLYVLYQNFYCYNPQFSAFFKTFINWLHMGNIKIICNDLPKLTLNEFLSVDYSKDINYKYEDYKPVITKFFSDIIVWGDD